jgi:membrane protease YdiL (CAAX protease family)
VFWEDAVFTLPILFWERYSNPSKWLVYPVLAASAIFFGMGHLYQGIMGGVMAAFYLFVISYGYGKKHGLGTVMICHVLYDMLTFWVIQSSQ